MLTCADFLGRVVAIQAELGFWSGASQTCQVCRGLGKSKCELGLQAAVTLALVLCWFALILLPHTIESIRQAWPLDGFREDLA